MDLSGFLVFIFLYQRWVGRCNHWQCKRGLLPKKSINSETDVQTIDYVIHKNFQCNLLGGIVGLHSVCEAQNWNG